MGEKLAGHESIVWPLEAATMAPRNPRVPPFACVTVRSEHTVSALAPIARELAEESACARSSMTRAGRECPNRCFRSSPRSTLPGGLLVQFRTTPRRARRPRTQPAGISGMDESPRLPRSAVGKRPSLLLRI